MGQEKTIISIISEQTIPNLVFIKEYIRENPGKYNILFITTGKMEKEGTSDNVYKAIESTCKNFMGKYEKLEVPHDDFKEIKNKLNLILNEKIKYIVNITGGTKIMSLALFETMTANKVRYNSVIYYLTLGKNSYMQIYPDKIIKNITNFVTLNEYLNSYGIDFHENSKCLMDYKKNVEFTNNYFQENQYLLSVLTKLQNENSIKKSFRKNQFIDLNGPKVFDKFCSILKSFEENKADKQIETKASAMISSLKTILSFLDTDTKKISRPYLRYLTGGWFEEFVFQKIKVEQNIPEESIAMNLEILSTRNEKTNIKKTQNEFDILYINNKNALTIIECKSSMDSNLAQSTLYKMAALKKYFGIQARSVLYTMTLKKDLSESVFERAEILGIRIITGESIYLD